METQAESSSITSTDEQLDKTQHPLKISETTTSESSQTTEVNPFRKSTSSINNVHALTKPNQPGGSFKFPGRTFGARERSFQSSWFAKHTWLHYDEESDKAFCFICIKAHQSNAVKVMHHLMLVRS